jgi:D-3-phosphoglycerate dehydrogenase
MEKAKYGVAVLDLPTLLKTSQIITLHVPGNVDKSPVLGVTELALLQQGSFVINISRGGVIDEDALLALLQQRKIAGAAIDVFNEEPYTGPFCDLENVILTPHIGSYAEEGKLLMEVEAVNNLVNCLVKQ